MVVQPSLCRTRLETPKTRFLITRPISSLIDQFKLCARPIGAVVRVFVWCGRLQVQIPLRPRQTLTVYQAVNGYLTTDGEALRLRKERIGHGLSYEPRSEKTGLRDFRPGLTQTRLEAGNFVVRK